MALGPTGATLRDWSGRRNHGVLTNMSPNDDWVVSEDSYCLDFDGTDDYVLVSSVFGMTTTNLTMCCWVKCASTSESGAFLHLGDGAANPNNNGFALGVGSGTYDTNGNNFIGLYEGVQWHDTSTTLGTGWNWVALVLKQNSQAPEYFLNGVRVYTLGANAPRTPTNYFFIGGYEQTASFPRYANIQVDDVRVYNRAITRQDIELLASERNISYYTEPFALTAEQAAAAAGTPYYYNWRRRTA